MTSASEEQYPGEPFRLGKPNVASDRRPQYVEAEIQVARHAADDRELLPVLFAKDRDVGADLVEQLGDEGREPVEMAGTRRAAIIGAQLKTEEPRVGKEFVPTVGSRWTPYH